MSKFRDGEKWPENGSVNYNTILQLDLYCRKIGKWTEVPCVQVFMVLYQNPALGGSCNQKPGELENPRDILDDPLLTPNSQGGNRAPPTPDSTPTSSEPPTSLVSPTSPELSDRPQTPPPYVPLYPPIPQERETSPSGVTRSGTSCHPGSGKLSPLREVANSTGTIGIYVPFSLIDLAQCKQTLG